MAEMIIPEPARQLEVFIGIWEVSGSMAMEGKSLNVTGRWQFSRIANGHGIRTTSQTTIEGLGAFDEEELIGFDPGDGKIHLFSLNKFAVRDHVGTWKEDQVLYVEYTGIQEGKQCHEGITIRFEGDQMHADIVETLEGKVIVTTKLNLMREAFNSND